MSIPNSSSTTPEVAASPRSVITGQPLGTPVFRSALAVSVTSLSRTVPGPTEVFLDERCGHLQTAPLPDAGAYYDTGYRIIDTSDEDDVLHDVVDGRCVYRQSSQEAALRATVDIRAGMRILDYGCGKGTVMKRLLASEPGLQGFLYDISRTYEPLWARFLPAERFATYRLRPEWSGTFDVVTSFFSLEHAINPVAELQAIRGLLRAGGTAFIIVPDAEANPADMVVVDHAHHYSEPSLRLALAAAGLRTTRIARDIHAGAIVATATPASPGESVPVPAATEVTRANDVFRVLARYWTEMQARVRALEAAPAGSPRAIYGAGVYGTFIAACLERPGDIACFVDRNPLLHAAPHLGVPVVPPARLPQEVRAVYAGLNPASARRVLSEVAEWRGRELEFLFLPEFSPRAPVS